MFLTMRRTAHLGQLKVWSHDSAQPLVALASINRCDAKADRSGHGLRIRLQGGLSLHIPPHGNLSGKYRPANTVSAQANNPIDMSEITKTIARPGATAPFGLCCISLDALHEHSRTCRPGRQCIARCG